MSMELLMMRNRCADRFACRVRARLAERDPLPHLLLPLHLGELVYPRPETRIPRPETRNTKHENPKTKTRKTKHETRKTKHETRTPKTKQQIRIPQTRIRHPNPEISDPEYFMFLVNEITNQITVHQEEERQRQEDAREAKLEADAAQRETAKAAQQVSVLVACMHVCIFLSM